MLVPVLEDPLGADPVGALVAEGGAGREVHGELGLHLVPEGRHRVPAGGEGAVLGRQRCRVQAHAGFLICKWVNLGVWVQRML